MKKATFGWPFHVDESAGFYSRLMTECSRSKLRRMASNNEYGIRCS